MVFLKDCLAKLGPTEPSRMFDLFSFFLGRKLTLVDYYVVGPVLNALHGRFLLPDLVRTLGREHRSHPTNKAAGRSERLKTLTRVKRPGLVSAKT